MQDPVMSIDEIAEHLGIKPESVRSLMRRHKVPHKNGYLRADVLQVERKQGRRTDLQKDFNA
jgi:uncharacterized protein YjcR